jgi:hypothetical protein
VIEKSLASVVSAFGTACKAKLANRAAVGAPEDQLRAPLENLFRGLAEVVGLASGDMALVGENTITDLKSRPDYAVTLGNTLVGFIEIKAPGKGADPRRFTDEHDKKQWAKLKSLPNLLYTDGNAFSLWRNGVLQGTVVVLDGDVSTSGSKLSAPATFLPLVADFLQWNPEPPRTVKQLAETAARLCRLLRDEVAEELERQNKGLTSLADEWRGLLFPQASDAEFADGYAQAVTFGLLVARTRGIALSGGIEHAAVELRRSNSLIGTALRLLTDNEDVRGALDGALRTLARVLDAVDWPTLTKGDVDAWLYFYEDFLAVYDNALRKRTGSYYTPPQVVEAMVRMVDEALRDPDLFGLPQGLASSDVVLADPAMGTGAYLLGALRSIARTVEADLGAGAVPGAIVAAAKRLIGFEMQFGPFAVAQLRLVAEMQTLMNGRRNGAALPDLRLFITDTLGDPYAKQTQFSATTEPIGESRRKANVIKRDERITVVIGNPPYKDRAKGLGGWIEKGNDGRPSALSLWNPPPDWGVGQHLHNTKNLYVYFWRWATWKVFGAGHAETTGEAPADREGIVCFITASGFLYGDGFQKMREDLRRECSHIWVIDCSPEGHQPDMRTRIFQGVQQPVCIVMALRRRGKNRDTAAELKFLALPEGDRRDKFLSLDGLALAAVDWSDGPSDWRAPFLPELRGLWADCFALDNIFGWSTPGVGAYRTWVIAPDRQSLVDRWRALQSERNKDRRRLLFHEDRDRTLSKTVSVHLGRFLTPQTPVDADPNELAEQVRYGFRSFDRQWIPADHRLISQARSELWKCYSSKQFHLTAQQAHKIENGPAVTLTDLLPDLHHYNGRGGRAFPLWRDAAATVSNVKPELLAHLSLAYGRVVGPEDVMAYVAAVLAHPAFTARFQADLVRPGLRVPLTADAALFDEAVRLGREVIWLHCYGERFVDPVNGRPAGPPRLPKAEAPTIPKGGAIPGAPEPLPDTMDYDPAARRLRVGAGHVDNVPAAVWAYEVSGKNVLHQWFSYRKRDRSRPIIGDRRPPSPLDKVQPDHWLDEYTTDLMNLLHVLGRLVKLEPAQADLLDRICAAPLLPAALPEPPPATTPPAT